MSRFFRKGGDSSDSSSEESEEELLSNDSGDEQKPAKPAAASGSAKPMSRFLRTEGDDSESSSEDDDEDSDESDEADEAAEKPQKKTSRFLVGAGGDDDESEDEVKRVVKSAKDKRLDEMEVSSKVIDNAVKINDWVAINNEFDKLTRAVQRLTNIAEQVPSIYIRVLSGLEASLNTALAKEKDAKKKMDATKARALNGMKQKIKKITKEYEEQVKAFQVDPVAFEASYQASVAPEVQVIAPKKIRRAVDDDGAATGAPVAEDFTTVGRGGKLYNFASDSLYKNLQLIQEARGKKNTDRNEQMRILEKLLEVANTPYGRIRVLLALISARFDYNPSVATYMPIDLWLSAQREVDQLVAILTSEASAYAVEEDLTIEYDELVERVPTDKEPVVRVRGSIISFVERLDEEFTRSLQNIDPHGTEYVDRLKDEKGLYESICRAEAYFERVQQPDPLARVIMRRLEHIYSKPTPVVQALENSAMQALVTIKTSPSFPTLTALGSTTALIRALSVHLYQTENSLLRTRAMLSHIYHHALNNEFHVARDMFHMSHLPETIHNADVATQILYNRAVVQIGLCAFRNGLIKEAQSTLQDIFTTQRVKELLAQGTQQRYGVLTPEQEKAEKQRQLPFHMHINTELLEAAFLVSSMLVEIPLLASIDSEELKRKAISKPFRRLLEFADRQVFTGPPESTRDHIMQASKALQDGEWEKCRDLIQSIKIWSLMPEEKTVKEMLARRIQEEGLRTYLFTYSAFYATLSLSLLATTFSLPLRTVTSIVSKMIWNEELAASMDQGDGTIVFHRVELTRVQQMAQTLADKVSQLVEQNEKTLDAKLGGGAGWNDRVDGQKADRGDQQQERKGREGRPARGTARGGARGGRGAKFAQGLGKTRQ